jgi:galactonate dehydratase
MAFKGSHCRIDDLGWYQEVVTDLPVVEGGHVRPPDRPGLATRLQPGFTARPELQVQEFRPD